MSAAIVDDAEFRALAGARISLAGLVLLFVGLTNVASAIVTLALL